jgi:hypothetical protein
VLRVGAALDGEYRAFSPDLCQGWLRTVAEPTLSPGAIQGYPNVYRRTDSECGGPSFTAFTQAEPVSIPAEEYAALELQGTSADGSTAVYVAPAALAGTEAPANPGGHAQLYVKGEGSSTAFVCVLPNGQPTTGPCTAGSPSTRGVGKGRYSNLQGAISEDGRRVFWTSSEGDGLAPVYLRENPTRSQSAIEAGHCSEPEAACTVSVSAEAEALEGTNGSRFWAASPEGSLAILTSGKGLFAVSLAEEAGALVPHTERLAGGVQGVMGASRDAASVYFASSEALGGENAEGKSPLVGQPNLYLAQVGAIAFIGTLSPADLPAISHSELLPVAERPVLRAARVSPDGRHAAFLSFGAPTGYDNTDAADGEAAGELYVYDAESETLSCASCNPSAQRPLGRRYPAANNNHYTLAAKLAGWENDLYAPRAVATDGSRLFFESFDSLVPRDTNGVGDVYEWERLGAGGCSATSSGYAPENRGCVSLISSGKSSRDSEFLDASPAGNDVFFATLSSLVSADYGLVDVYDARVGGGFAAEAPPPAACEGEACQSPPEAPNDPTPTSASFQGAGNVVEASTRCAKPKRRRNGRCLKPHRKHRKHHGTHRTHRTHGRAGR